MGFEIDECYWAKKVFLVDDVNEADIQFYRNQREDKWKVLSQCQELDIDLDRKEMYCLAFSWFFESKWFCMND